MNPLLPVVTTIDWTDVEIELRAAGREDLAVWVHDEVEKVGIKAQAGLCAMSFGGARAFLDDIYKMCDQTPNTAETARVLGGVVK